MALLVGDFRNSGRLAFCSWAELKTRTNLLVVLPVVATLLATSLCTVALAKEDVPEGRKGSWRWSKQGAPSVAACKKRIAANPNDAVAHNDLGWALRQEGDLKGAEEELRQAIKLDDNLSFAHSNLSVVLLDAGKKDEALTEAKKAVIFNDKQPVFRVVLGNALLDTGDAKAAMVEYRAALLIQPDYENALYHLGRALIQDNRKSEAEMVLTQALSLDESDERVEKLLMELTP